MKKIIGTTSVKLNELFTQAEIDHINKVVNDTNAKAIIFKPITPGSTIYIEFSGDANPENGYPVNELDSLAFQKGSISYYSICSNINNTDIRFLFA